MTTKQVTPVYLTDDDAELFKQYVAHKPKFDVLCMAGVFDVKRGSVEIHFDSYGEIGAIIGTTRPVMYQREQLIVVSTK